MLVPKCFSGFLRLFSVAGGGGGGGPGATWLAVLKWGVALTRQAMATAPYHCCCQVGYNHGYQCRLPDVAYNDRNPPSDRPQPPHSGSDSYPQPKGRFFPNYTFSLSERAQKELVKFRGVGTPYSRKHNCFLLTQAEQSACPSS